MFHVIKRFQTTSFSQRRKEGCADVGCKTVDPLIYRTLNAASGTTPFTFRRRLQFMPCHAVLWIIWFAVRNRCKDADCTYCVVCPCCGPSFILTALATIPLIIAPVNRRDCQPFMNTSRHRTLLRSGSCYALATVDTKHGLGGGGPKIKTHPPSTNNRCHFSPRAIQGLETS